MSDTGTGGFRSAAAAQVEVCFERRRQCFDRYMAARRELEVALSIKGRAAAEPLATVASFARVSECKRRCAEADAACVEALIGFAHEVIDRARGASLRA